MSDHTPDLQAHEVEREEKHVSDEMKSCGFVQMGWKVAGSVVRAGLSERESTALTALKEWALASHAVEKADADVAAGGVEGYASLSQAARRAWESEQDKLTALRAAADALEDRG